MAYRFCYFPKRDEVYQKYQESLDETFTQQSILSELHSLIESNVEAQNETVTYPWCNKEYTDWLIGFLKEKGYNATVGNSTDSHSTIVIKL